MKHVVLVATRAGELLYHSRPLPEHVALMLRAEIRSYIRDNVAEDLVGPVVVMADKQDGSDQFYRART